MNPLLSDFQTRYGAVPFGSIAIDDYLPAFRAGIAEEDAEIAAITTNGESPTFANTIEAYEHAGQTLGRVSSVFFNLLETDGTDAMHAVAEEVQPLLTQHSNDVSLNRELFARIRKVYEQYHPTAAAGAQPLDEEQMRLLQATYDDFVESGALLEGDDRETWRRVTEELDSLTLQYEQNVLHATHDWSMTLTEADVADLPESLRGTLAEAATEPGTYLLTLQAPSYRPFMTYSSRRDLRERAYRAHASRAVGGKFDNTAIAMRIAELRRQMARMLGYATYADYNLATGTMARTPQRVLGLLDDLLDAYIEPARRDVDEVEAFARTVEGDETFHLEAWDFAYYSEKLKNERYAVDDELLRPYFPLDKVKQGVFGLATRLYGLTFTATDEVEKYHKEVETYVVSDADGSYLGLLYADFFPRKTKQGGAWMTEFKGQWLDAAGNDSRPHVSIVMNFTRPTASRPSLLTYDEVETLLHEFGHALHGLLTRCRFESMSGTNVAHDFVELPSQFNENFLPQREFLDTFAAHWQTGEKIPDAYIQRIRRSRNFQAAYSCIRQLSFGMLDMAWHSIGEAMPPTADGESAADAVATFERQATAATRLLPPTSGTLTSTAFTHIFCGGYTAGYYGYKWAEVLDADAFAAFEEEGLFNPATARRFRKLLEAGDSRDAAALFREFRGREPDIAALMARDGIIGAADSPSDHSAPTNNDTL